MKRVASLLSEVPPRQGAPARRDGALFQPLSAGIPPWAESGDKLCTIPSRKLSQKKIAIFERPRWAPIHLHPRRSETRA
jgi:hypothetical protein